MKSEIHEILKKYWGYDSFRPMQEDIIASVLSGNDTLGLMPTGGGKSITFQVPAIALGGLCIVVTPLISLMKDQIDRLTSLGIKAASVFMGMKHQEVLDTYERVIAQNYQFLYVSPERLETQLFKAKLQYMNVRLLVVDEAHCISQWGYDFRPPYLRIAETRRSLPPGIPCLALTATATPEVVKDIQAKLSFRRNAKVFRSSFVRPNLTYNVIRTPDKLGTMLYLLHYYLNKDSEGKENVTSCEEHQRPGAIIYVRSRRETNEIAETLLSEGFSASFYHAGLTSDEKQKRQDDWISGKVPIIAATNAFGMGIDKPNVRLVIHYDIPPSPEEYFQEAGRAGRDMKPSAAWMVVSSKDKLNLLKHLSEEYPERDYIRMVYQKLANFFQIAIGAGMNAIFEFDIAQFCATYKLQLSPTYYSIRLLAQAGYIIYNEEPDRHSRLMITTSRESLYHLDRFDREPQKVLQAILRSYTGLFADFVYIREEDLMAQTGLDREQVYQSLLLLTRFHVLHYIPARQKPAILYLTPRLDNDELRISHEIYEDRRARQEARINAMLSYIHNDEECRLTQLLRYFGEESDKPCGGCDVCRSKKEPDQAAIDAKKAEIRSQIIEILKAEGKMPSYYILKRTHAHKDLFTDLICEMVQNKELIKDRDLLSLPKN